MAKTHVSVQDSTFAVEKRAFLRLCEAIDSPRSLACAMLARTDQWKEYLDLGINPASYDSVGRFADDYLVSEIMTKNPRLPLETPENVTPDEWRRLVAIEKFHDSERMCAETNRRFRSQPLRKLPDGDPSTLRIINRAKRIIGKTLGELTRRDLNGVLSRARFGPGATSNVTGRAVRLSEKYSTYGATPRLRDLWKLLPRLWLEAFEYKFFSTVHASYVTTVPKNAKTDRCICVEPHMNIFVQLGIAGLLRTRLKRVGVDIQTQEWNQFLASKAEVWQLATLDLSSASDLISEALVEFLIPHRWLHLLRLARTEYTTLEKGGEFQPLQKWSSMGNGYTFELETLIFWALAKAASGPGAIVTAYGDDIICPQTAATSLVAALEYCGFSVNQKKSSLAGSFFESCGSDWFSGVNVRPIYFRAEVTSSDDKDDAILLYANQLRRWAASRNGNHVSLGCDSRLKTTWLMLRDAVPKRWQLFIPDGTGDGGLVGNFDEATPKYSQDWQCYTYTYRSRSAMQRPPRKGLGYLVSRVHKPERDRPFSSEPEWLRDLKEHEVSSSIRVAKISGDKWTVDITDSFFGEGARGELGSPHEATGHPSGWPDLGPWCKATA